MSDSPWIVVKVGGSLFDLPDLRGRLQALLAEYEGAHVLLVPGGGARVEAIRTLDRVHQLGEEAAHWLAIEAMSVNARFLQALLPEASLVGELVNLACASGWNVLDALPFFQADECRDNPLPHRWGVTSDSLAVRAATLAQARELILLKSIDWSNGDWAEASRAGIVDGYFAAALQQAPAGMGVRVMNLRASSEREA
jgi:aspartokinase-like uncharacterized kinase